MPKEVFKNWNKTQNTWIMVVIFSTKRWRLDGVMFGIKDFDLNHLILKNKSLGNFLFIFSSRQHLVNYLVSTHPWVLKQKMCNSRMLNWKGIKHSLKCNYSDSYLDSSASSFIDFWGIGRTTPKTAGKTQILPPWNTT